MKLLAAVALLFGIGFLQASALAADAENWPGFRGPTGLGYTREKGIPVEWGGPEGKNVLWKSPLEGEGHASPIVWGEGYSFARRVGRRAPSGRR